MSSWQSIWKGSFVDAFLLRMKKKRALILNRVTFTICRNSLIAPYDNGKTPVRCKITEATAVGQQFGEFASTWKRRLSRTNIGPGRKREVKPNRIWHEKEIRFR